MPNVNIDLGEQEHDRLADIKEAHGLTWRGLLLQGANKLGEDPLGTPATVQDYDIAPIQNGWRMEFNETGDVYESNDGRNWEKVEKDNEDTWSVIPYDGMRYDEGGSFWLVAPPEDWTGGPLNQWDPFVFERSEFEDWQEGEYHKLPEKVLRAVAEEERQLKTMRRLIGGSY